MANSKLARSLRVKLQLRDKKGRWIEMGRGGKWYSSLDGTMKSGVVIGSKGNNAVIREKNADGTLGPNNVEVPMNTLEMIPSKASLDPQTLQLMNEYNEGQSSKGKKESAAREQALSDAMASEENGGEVLDEVEVEYEASAEEELEDLLDEAPQGAMLLKNDASGKHTFKKGADGNWSDGIKEPTTSNLLANNPSVKDYQYVGTGEVAKKANEVLAELAKGTSAPAKEKKSWFGKKKTTDEAVDPTDSLIESTNEKLGIPQQQQQVEEEDVTAPEAVETPAEPEALIDISAWKYHQGTQGGSNPGGIYTDTEGNDHYVKKSKSDMHAKNEVMADKFYEKLGVKTSQLKLADVGGGKLGTSSKMVPGSKNDFYNKSMSDPAYKKKFQEDFAIDAWLANWDVVGLEYDNALTDANGDPIRIDPGGALLYRAMGSPKGDMFGPEVGEWESMRNGSNPASKIFGSMSDEDLKNSVAKLKNISDEDIAEIVDSMEFEQDVADYVKNTLSARRQNLLNKFPELANEPDQALPSEEEGMDTPEQISETPAPEVVPVQKAKPEPISAPEAPTETQDLDETPAPAAKTSPEPFITTPEEAPVETDYQAKKEAWKAEKETHRAAALAGEKLDFSNIPSLINNGDDHFEDYWEDEDEITPAFAGHFESYTVAEADALGEYVGGSDEVNGILRGNKQVFNYLTEDEFAQAAGTINKLDDIISKSVVQEDTTVYRGVAMRQSNLDKFLEGGAYEDLAYSSTSTQQYTADSWSQVDLSIDPDRVQVTLDMKLPAGFTAHKVDYLVADKKNYVNEKEVILPRATKFAIVATDMGEEPEEGKARSVKITVEPILNDSNYKPEGIKNGQGSNNTADSGDGNSSGSTGEDVSNDSSGGEYENPSEGAGTAGDQAESGSEGVQEPEVAPVADNATPAGNDMGEEIPIINGAKAMLSQMAKKQGISVEQLQKDLGLPADGAFPNKGKTVSNDNGDVFEANSIVSNPKFGEGIASIILPSTNSVKVLYADHGFKVTQAKNLSLVSGTAPQEVASQAINLDGAAPGDVGINPANGKMYFVDKNGSAKYVGDEVEYTKKGVTQHGKVASIYKGTKTAKIEWDDDTASVKKASQLIGKENEPAAGDDSDTTPNTPETDTTSPEAPEQAPEPVETPEAPAVQESVEEPVESPEETVNKGWTVTKEYDPMGPTKIELLSDKSAKVYAHDNSALYKDDFNIPNKTGFNPVENAYYGVGHNLQPLYVGDDVTYIFTGKKYEGKIVEVKPVSQSAVVLLDDGTKKVKKFSQLSGNQPKYADVDENGNYTDWSGNAAQIPNFKGTAETSPEDVTPDEVIPEPAQKIEWGQVVNSEIGQSLTIGDDTYYRIGGSYQGDWFNPKNGAILNAGKIFNLFNDSEDVTLSDAPISNISVQEMEDMGIKAKISSEKLGLSLTKDADGDWYTPTIGYVLAAKLETKVKTDDWVIESTGDDTPQVSVSDLQGKSGGQTLTIGDKTYFKFGDGSWWSKEDSTYYPSNEISEMIDSEDSPVRFGDLLSSNLSYDDLSEFNTGAEIYSEKLGMTLEKDSDGDWTSYGLGYYTDDVLDSIISDDWVVQSTGQIEPNYTSYDLDSANAYSTLYSSELDESFTKGDGGDWISDNTGNDYSSDTLLSEFPTNDWSLSESEIDDDYSYGLGEYQFAELNPGSKISHTASPNDAPEEYIKIGDNHWVSMNANGYPDVDGPSYEDDSFEDGYTWISHEEQGEYEVPELLNIEPNTPDIAAADVSLEWLDSAPVGTAIKSAQSEKWTYIKNSDGKWVTTDPEGGTGAAGTSEQVYNASKDKHDLTNIYVPGAEESTATEETPVVEQVAADFAVGTFIPQTGAPDTGFTKVGDNQWKMTSAGQEVDHVLEDSFIDAFQKATYNAPVFPTPDSDDTADVTPTEEINTPEDLPESIQGMSPEAFDAIPVTTKMFNSDSGYTYEKISPTVWVAYKGTVNDGMEVEFTSDTFHGILNLASASQFKIQPKAEEDSENNISDPSAPKLVYGMTLQELEDAPQGATISYTGPESWKAGTVLTKNGAGEWENSEEGAPNDTSEGLVFFTKEPMIGKNWTFSSNGQVSDAASAADLADVPTATNTQEISFAEFQKLPVGSKIVPSWAAGWKKTDDNEWESIETGGQFVDDNFTSYVGHPGFQDGMSIVYPTQSSENTENTEAPANTLGTPKPLSEVSKEEILDAPVGSVVTHLPTGDTYTKIEDGMWSTGKSDDMSHTSESIAWVIGKPSDVQYTFTPSQTPEKINYPESLAGFTNTEDFDKLPIGSTIGTTDNPDIYTKTGKNKWGIASNPDKHTDSTFHYIITSNGGEVYKLNVPEGATPVDNTLDEPTSASPVQDGPKTLAGIGEAEYKALPEGTIITSTNGASLTKQNSGDWVHNNGTVLGADIIDIIHSGPDAGSWTISPEKAKSAAPNPSAPGVHKGQKVSEELADSYPVGTVIKKENPAYYGMSGQFYYVKLEDGTWQMYKQTDKTLSAKSISTSSGFNNWTYYTASVSVPKSGEHFVTHTGELGYVGDYVDHEGGTYQVSKIMKTGVKLTDGSSHSITVKPQKLKISSSTFGMKDTENSQSSATTDSSTPESVDLGPVDLGYDLNLSSDFAGASAEEYNKQGLVTPVHDPANLNVLMQLAPKQDVDPTNPLYGAPQPEEPAKPNLYPAFQEPELTLPSWDSDAWLAKVEQRYLDNPNKAKATVQESNKWSAIQSVLQGNKENLSGLLSSMYLDQDLFDEAVSGIDTQEALNEPLVEAHKKTVADAKDAYDSAKADHIANYTSLKEKYSSDMAAWMAANPDPDAKQLPKKPATSKENFLGGEADWTKSHIGTFTGESVFAAIKSDNAVGRHGLGIATDSDKIEGLNVFAYKILGTDGEEKLDFRFGLTKEHGNTLHSWIKKQPNVQKESNIYTPNMALNVATGLNKEQVGTHQINSGHRYTYTHEATGARIIFQRDTSEKEFNNNSSHNTVRIVMPVSAGTAEYQEVLEHLGISGKPASEGDIRVLAENKLIQSMGSGADVVGDNNLKGDKRKKTLEAIKKKFDVTPENIVFRADVNGKVRAFYDADTVAKLSKRFSDIKAFKHSLSNSTDIKMWESLLTGSHPGLLSTYHRWSNGIGFSGMSSSTDIQEGSGDSPFLTPLSSLPTYGHGQISIHPSAVIQHLDLWVNKGDYFGKKGQGTHGMNGPHEQLDKWGSNFHEAMVIDGIPLSDIMYILVDTSMKKKIIEMLQKKGVLKINGFSLDDFFLDASSGQQPAKADYIPGFGVVPAGTTLEQALADPSFGLTQPGEDLGGALGGGEAVGGPAI